jgi:hypothetical protein
VFIVERRPGPCVPRTLTTAGDGFVTVAGYASLVDEASARATTPNLSNWRLGRVEGFGRVFDLVSIINIRRGLAADPCLATCTARPMAGHRLRVCLYDIPAADFPALEARERRLATTRVDARQDDGAVVPGVVMFTQYSDVRYRAERATTSEMWHEEVGQYYNGDGIYRRDCLPVPSYLQRCLAAYASIGDVANFLDHSFLADGTPLRKYTSDAGTSGAQSPSRPNPVRAPQHQKSRKIYACAGTPRASCGGSPPCKHASGTLPRAFSATLQTTAVNPGGADRIPRTQIQ